MADLFQHRVDESYAALTQQFQDKPEVIAVPEDQQVIGFDAYKKAMDVLKPGDIAIFASPLAFRWVHFQYAIERGLNVFMEKPVVADGPTGKRMLELAKKADEKNLKCGVGLMVRHCRGRQELHKRIQDGEIGDIIRMRAYRMHGPVATCFSTRKPDGPRRAALADRAVPQLPVGERRIVQRLLHPSDRRSLLDEERLAGEGPGPGRPPLSAATTSTRISTPTPSSTRSTTARSSSSTAAR